MQSTRRLWKMTESISDKIRQPANKIAELYYVPASRIMFLRGMVGISLFVAAIVVGVANYFLLTKSEHSFGASQFKSISVQGLNNMVGSFSRMTKGTLAMAKMYRTSFPKKEVWPNVALPGFYEIAAEISDVSSVDNIIFSPVVLPEQLVAFEAYMMDYWLSEPEYIAGGPVYPAAVLGVWSVNPAIPPPPVGPFPEGYFYHDTTGHVLTWNSSYPAFLLPILQLTFSPDLSPFLLGNNGHDSEFLGRPVEAVLACVKTHLDYNNAQNKCGRLTSTVSLPAPSLEDPDPVTTNMQAFISHPVVLRSGNDTDQGAAVGIVSGAVNWQTLLSRAVPSYVDGVDCVVTASDGSFTYSMVQGVAQFIGTSDLHDHHYDEYARSISLLAESIVESDTEYTLTFYPRRDFFEAYETNNPLYTTIGAVCIIVFCALLFFAYDIATSRESLRKEVILDTKRRFVRFISHEIRTPLNTVRLGLKLLEIELETAAKQVATGTLAVKKGTLTDWVQLTDDILGNSDSAVDVLNDLLNYDKIETGTLRLEFSSVAIWTLIRKTVAAFVMQAKQKGVHMQLKGRCWEDGLPVAEAQVFEQLRVVGDSTRIAQVLRNLISNALKFTPEAGKVVVAVEWLPNGLPNAVLSVPKDQAVLLDAPRCGSICVSVTDSGAGLSPQQLSEICSEGVQFNANQLQAGQGSGLGLFISKGLTEQHGGVLQVFSEGLGRGATFCMELPLYRSELDTRGVSSGSVRVKPANNSALSAAPNVVHCTYSEQIPEAGEKLSKEQHDCRVLVVDDAASNRKLLMRILRAKGYVVSEATNGQEAVDVYTRLRAEGEIVDAILMDFEMPVLDGPGATEKLRELGCNCFIAGVTGNVLPADIALFQQAGANSVLAKPLNIETFESVFKSHRAVPDAAWSLSAAAAVVGADGAVDEVHTFGNSTEKKPHPLDIV